jgi:hypothetical protein
LLDEQVEGPPVSDSVVHIEVPDVFILACSEQCRVEQTLSHVEGDLAALVHPGVRLYAWVLALSHINERGDEGKRRQHTLVRHLHSFFNDSSQSIARVEKRLKRLLEKDRINP